MNIENITKKLRDTTAEGFKFISDNFLKLSPSNYQKCYKEITDLSIFHTEVNTLAHWLSTDLQAKFRTEDYMRTAVTEYEALEKNINERYAGNKLVEAFWKCLNEHDTLPTSISDIFKDRYLSDTPIVQPYPQNSLIRTDIIPKDNVQEHLREKELQAILEQEKQAILAKYEHNDTNLERYKLIYIGEGEHQKKELYIYPYKNKHYDIKNIWVDLKVIDKDMTYAKLKSLKYSGSASKWKAVFLQPEDKEGSPATISIEEKAQLAQEKAQLVQEKRAQKEAAKEAARERIKTQKLDFEAELKRQQEQREPK